MQGIPGLTPLSTALNAAAELQTKNVRFGDTDFKKVFQQSRIETPAHHERVSLERHSQAPVEQGPRRSDRQAEPADHAPTAPTTERVAPSGQVDRASQESASPTQATETEPGATVPAKPSEIETSDNSDDLHAAMMPTLLNAVIQMVPTEEPLDGTAPAAAGTTDLGVPSLQGEITGAVLEAEVPENADASLAMQTLSPEDPILEAVPQNAQAESAPSGTVQTEQSGAINLNGPAFQLAEGNAAQVKEPTAEPHAASEALSKNSGASDVKHAVSETATDEAGVSVPVKPEAKVQSVGSKDTAQTAEQGLRGEHRSSETLPAQARPQQAWNYHQIMAEQASVPLSTATPVLRASSGGIVAEQINRWLQELDASQLAIREGKVTQMEVTLEPRNLGKLVLKLTMENGELKAHFATQSQIVKQTLESQMGELKDTLQQHGLNVGQLNVQVGHGQQRSSNPSGNAGDQAQQTSGRDAQRSVIGVVAGELPVRQVSELWNRYTGARLNTQV